MLLSHSAYFIKNETYKLNNSTLYQYKEINYNLSLKKKPSHHTDAFIPSYYVNIFFNDFTQPQNDYSLYLYQPCKMTLSNSNSLWNYILNYYNINIYLPYSQNASHYTNYVEYILQNIIIVFYSSVYDYTAVKTVLFWPDVTSKIICLNIKSITTFIDWVLVNVTKI